MSGDNNDGFDGFDPGSIVLFISAALFYSLLFLWCLAAFIHGRFFVLPSISRYLPESSSMLTVRSRCFLLATLLPFLVARIAWSCLFAFYAKRGQTCPASVFVASIILFGVAYISFFISKLALCFLWVYNRMRAKHTLMEARRFRLCLILVLFIAFLLIFSTFSGLSVCLVENWIPSRLTSLWAVSMTFEMCEPWTYASETSVLALSTLAFIAAGGTVGYYSFWNAPIMDEGSAIQPLSSPALTRTTTRSLIVQRNFLKFAVMTSILSFGVQAVFQLTLSIPNVVESKILKDVSLTHLMLVGELLLGEIVPTGCIALLMHLSISRHKNVIRDSSDFQLSPR